MICNSYERKGRQINIEVIPCSSITTVLADLGHYAKKVSDALGGVVDTGPIVNLSLWLRVRLSRQINGRSLSPTPIYVWFRPRSDGLPESKKGEGLIASKCCVETLFVCFKTASEMSFCYISARP